MVELPEHDKQLTEHLVHFPPTFVYPIAQLKQKELENGAVHPEQLLSQLRQEFKELKITVLPEHIEEQLCKFDNVQVSVFPQKVGQAWQVFGI